MHAISFSDAWHHWRDHAAKAAPAARRTTPPPTSASPSASVSVSTPVRLDDDADRPVEPMKWLPLAVPGMALLLLVCATAIGTLLR